MINKYIRYLLIISCSLLFFTHASAQKKQHLEGIKTGMQAPEIEMPNTEGEIIKLSDLKGKVVLINFWAAWCVPCRKKAPALIDLLEKYKSTEFDDGENGFEIFSVSLDKNDIAWNNAIAKDSVQAFINVGDMQGWDSEAIEKYHIKKIPTNILVDGEGEIVAINLQPKDLDKKLKRLKNGGWFWF